jgi:hypothetical protein
MLNLIIYYTMFKTNYSSCTQLGDVKIYVAAVEALRKKRRQHETQFTTKIDSFLSFIPP